MKGFLLLTGLALLVALTALLALVPAETRAEQPPQAETVTIPISGMT